MTRLNSKLSQQSTFGFSKRNVLIGHVELAKEFPDSFSAKSLEQKNSGKFYTPESIAIPLIRQVMAFNFKSSVSKLKIIDPFCGDGRLVAWMLPFLKALKVETEIHLWDYDDAALSKAAVWVRSEARRLDIKTKIIVKKVDSFAEFFRDAEESFDIVITNPPWEVVKPEPKDLVKFTEAKKKQYILSLKEFSERITRDFPLSRPAKAYGGWGVNLARVGTELSVRLAKQKGIVALITPATIFADQNSYCLRQWLFAENTLRHLNIYPAELKLFAGVDQPCISFVLKRATVQKTLRISHYQYLDRPVATEVTDLKTLLLSTDNILPVSIVANSAQLDILSIFSQYPRLSELEQSKNLWIGREMDETNYKMWTAESGTCRFLKGRDIERFNLSEESPVFLDNRTTRGKVPESTQFQRIIWRDISRPNQRRRMIATLIAPGNVTGNSLGVLHLRSSDKEKTLLSILGLISSYMFEFQLRAYLATAHVSAGVLKKMRTPVWDEEFTVRLSEIVNRRLNGDKSAEHEMEIRIAQAYEFNREQYAEILRAFPKIANEEKDLLLNSNFWTQ
jgi:Alw26I/Eco31I/Esp3I family type II restriction m6 adenine DNA methyltransferase